MKVIKIGGKKIPFPMVEWVGVCICGGCNSVLSVSERDLVRYRGSIKRPKKFGWDFVAFICGHCEESNTIDCIPDVVKKGAKETSESPPKSYVSKDYFKVVTRR